MCTKNYDQMMYGSWDMVHGGRTDERKKWHIEVGAPPKKPAEETKEARREKIWILQSSLGNLFLEVAVPSSFKHCKYYAELLVFFLKFRLLPVCEKLN